MSKTREPVAEIGAEDYRIVRHTHDVELATELMQAELNRDYGQECVAEFGEPAVGRPVQVWCRITPCLPNSFGASEGWSSAYTYAEPHSRGSFRAVVFHT
jgi:hypothetical protein